jgi:hypothetical protein
MAVLEKLLTYPVICEGGMDSNENYVLLSQRTPGAGINLLNYEPSLFGGYRKIDGFAPLVEEFPDVDDAGSEGKILGIHFYDDGIIVQRKTQSVSTYQHFFWTADADWTPYTTGLTHTATDVHKVRSTTYNFFGPESILFVDGVNPAVIFDGTTWTEIDPSNTGTNLADAGGPMALEAPAYTTMFKNHVFVAGDPDNPAVVAHSAPAADYDWLAASGAGQLNVGFTIRQIKPFRDELFVFGANKIKKIVVEGTDFVLKDVTNNGGLLASDSIVEVNGDLHFLAADGIRTVAATERNNDTELGVISKKIQQDMTELISSLPNFSGVEAVVLRKKSQVRFFFSDENLDTERNQGVIGGLKGDPGQSYWEWGLLKGIRTSCTASAYIGSEEYVIHGDYNGKVYRQESGTSFDGTNILANYTTPYLDMGDIYLRKTIHKITVFIRPEAETLVTMNMSFDWGDREILTPSPYLLEATSIGTTYGVGVYGTDIYATTPPPYLIKNVEGSNFSVSLNFTSDDMTGSHSIQAIVFEYSVNGRK